MPSLRGHVATYSKPTIILGIDPGSRITGIGVIRAQGADLKYIYSESLKLPSGELPGRLQMIYARLTQVIGETSPDIVAIERVFLAKNPQSALVLGHARGAAMLAAVNHALPVMEYSATEIKKTVVGRGRADKAQVQHMMRVLLGLRVAPGEDASDALAAAVCHAHHQQLNTALRHAE
ncbi:crossover junction endodeoxyribonuclease RuvC [Arenicella chitinivorans]|uniref:Crossover junction endodeoxyribonuclease RuvC n=1 Tax=Arenicella chitinivorans TaxID=1329800 RepID=A0A918RT80_9GAMM|nr:crossover junction endodeoxyribonuclease RuvC [Arenicella chitinivorans]GHA11897.1 crossover junction endodeoxyribonuclease RuvC [Arenicella chitinivorans]